MRRFLKKISLFGCGILLAYCALLALPLDKKFAYRFILGDCYAHGAWIWEQLTDTARRPDIVFLGSSRTLHAVWENRIEDTLAQRHDQNRSLLNLGYRLLGNYLCYAFANDLFQIHQPRLLFWEVRELEDRYSHPIFGYVADAGDVAWPAAGLHTRIVSDHWHAATVRLEYWRARLFGSELWAMPVDTARYGYAAESRMADAGELQAHKAENATRDFNEKSMPRMPRIYLEKTAELARQHGVRMVFLYLPAYGAGVDQPVFLENYRQMGAVLLPPKTILDNPANWLDHGHMNDRGAAELAGWLAGELARL